MEEFTFEEVVRYQIAIILASDNDEDRGLEGKLLNPGNLDFALSFCIQYSNPFDRAAYILHSLATGHPFVQGNKRIAFLLAALILLRTAERYVIMSSDIVNNRFVRDVAQGIKTQKDVKDWLISITKKSEELF